MAEHRMPAGLENGQAEQVTCEPRGGVRDGVVDEPRRLPGPAQEARQHARLNPDRVEGHAAAHLTGLRAPQVERVEAAPDLLLVSQEPFRKTCDAADLRGERRDQPDRLVSHGRLSKPAGPRTRQGSCGR